MAAEESRDSTAVKISTEAAESFADSFYTALQGARHTIASYYLSASTLADGKTIPSISWNGNTLQDGVAVQAMFENDMPFTHYEVNNLNCHVLNPTAIQPPPKTSKEKEKNMSIVVMVSGSLRLEEASKGPIRAFSESFILVPNTEKTTAGKHAHQWLVHTQNFRYVV